jgi:hypothetical protein
VFPDLFQDLPEIFDHFRSKRRKPEFLLNPYKLLFNGIPVFVFEGMKKVEVVPV